MQAGSTRRSSRGTLDTFTGIALAGTAALIIAFVILWLTGTNMANDLSGQGAMPWDFLGK
jgi:hypothetical protein